MKLVSIAVLVLAVASSQAQDDGRYRPHVYGGDDGQYRATDHGLYQHTTDGQYQSLYDRTGKYGPIYSAYRQVPYYQALNRNIISPYVQYGGIVDPVSYPSNLAGVTYRPPVVSSTVRPVVYSSPRPQVYAQGQYAADHTANIIRQDQDIGINGYRYSFQTDNGIAAEEAGTVEAAPTGEANRVQGFYEYVGDTGLTYRVDYTADENGFHPAGAHLPKLGAQQ